MIIFLALSLQLFTGLDSKISPTQGSASEPLQPLNGSCNNTLAALTPRSTPANEIANISLEGGASRCVGQLHLRLTNASLVTVCSRGFSLSEAHVVCRELGCGLAHGVVAGRTLGNSTAAMWHQGLECHRNESKLSECIKVPRTCHPGEQVGVLCSRGHTELRLLPGPGRCQGTPTLYNPVFQRPLSSLKWTPQWAELVCKRLHCGRAVNLTERPANETTALVNDPTCFAPEAEISRCLTEDWHGEFGKVASITCSEGELPPFRLVDGENPCVGKLNVFHRGSWKPVCRTDWKPEDRRLLCAQLACDGPGNERNGAGLTGRNRTGTVGCVKCQSRGVTSLIDKRILWDCTEQPGPYEQINITCPDLRPAEKPVVRGGPSGAVTACIVLVLFLALLLSLAYGWKLYQRNGKQVFRRKQTQRQWIGPTGAASHAVSFHRNNNAHPRPASAGSFSDNLYSDPPEKGRPSAYPALERRANPAVHQRDNSSESDYDFFDTEARRI